MVVEFQDNDQYLVVEDTLADNSFIQKLRMNSIFPAQGNPSPLIGMPDFSTGRQVPPYYGIQQQQQQQEQQQPIRQQMEPGLQRVGQQITKPQVLQQQEEGPNVVYQPGRSDTYGTDILMGTTEYDKHRRAKELLGLKTEATQATAQGTLAVKQQLANIAKFKAENPGLKAIATKGGNVQLMNPLTGEMIDTGVATGSLTEQDKIDLTGEKALEQIGAHGDIGSRQIGERGDIQRELQGTRGTQALEQIGARIAGQKEVAGIQIGSPTQQKALQATAIQQIQTTRPDLAKYLVKDPTTGQVQISQDTPLNELSMIQDIINPKTPQKDIELPSGGTPKSKTPTSKTPTAADLIKKYGG